MATTIRIQNVLRSLQSCMLLVLLLCSCVVVPGVTAEPILDVLDGNIDTKTGAVLSMSSLLDRTGDFENNISSISPRIVGGIDADPTLYPFYAYLEISKRFVDGQTGANLCGGTLIHPNIILTAAHCFIDDITEEVLEILVIVNRTQEFPDDPSAQFERAGRVDFITHPDFVFQTFENDIAFVVLETSVLEIEPVRYNPLPEVPLGGDTVDVIGFGTLSEGTPAEFPTNLQSATLQVVDIETCSAALSPVGVVIEQDLHTCAAADGQDACQGDSGGPLLLLEEGGESFTQVGIVSFGIGCANPSFPGVYARVSNYIPLIQDTICQQGEQPLPEFCSDDVTAVPATVAPVEGGGAPVTEAPATPAPVGGVITDAPVTEAPVEGGAPVAPVTNAPVTEAPVEGGAPVAPVTNAPVTEAPVEGGAPVAPVTNAPVTEAPVEGAPAAPVTNAPVTEAPVEGSPVAPVTDAPVTEAPAAEGPVAPVTDAPVTEAPVVVPVTDAPVTMAPVTVPTEDTIAPNTPAPGTPVPTPAEDTPAPVGVPTTAAPTPISTANPILNLTPIPTLNPILSITQPPTLPPISPIPTTPTPTPPPTPALSTPGPTLNPILSITQPPTLPPVTPIPTTPTPPTTAIPTPGPTLNPILSITPAPIPVATMSPTPGPTLNPILGITPAPASPTPGPTLGPNMVIFPTNNPAPSPRLTPAPQIGVPTPTFPVSSPPPVRTITPMPTLGFQASGKKGKKGGMGKKGKRRAR